MSDLKLLMKNRGKKTESKVTGTSRAAVNLPPPPPPPQVPDPGLKPIPDLKKKRPLEPEEREVVIPPKTTKQQKVVRDHRSKRASSVESREEPPVADVRRGQRTWSPILELDGVPFSWETSITQQVFMAEEWNRKAYVEAQAEAHSRSKAEKALGSLKEEAEAQHKLLNDTQNNLASEKALVKELCTELQKAREATKQAQRDAQLSKEATEAEKKIAYQLGVKVTEKGLTE
nr:uncharacterized protein LOC112021679 [Quercus suber]XP_023917063.1 uncharacterized protein LOC112028600 [Quercus suber]